jgi:predicted GNAT family N-acyltransferase
VSTPAVEVRPARGRDEVRAALRLRHKVFVEEQGVPRAEELDAHDATALHLVALNQGRVVGTCRLLASGETVKLGRMAVARGARGRGVAARLLAEADVRALELGARRMALGAQLTARRVYERAGYVAYGDHFVEAGIEHVMMEKRLA